MSLGQGRRILSVQSSVCSGYVGNRSATFPLQLLGYDVSCLNTVQFAVHTGYPSIHGQRLSPSDITTLFQGLQENADPFEGLLTGYVPGQGITAIRDIAKTLKEKGIMWVLDPVMGDEERGLYVADSIPGLYRSMVGMADIITPNQFELEMLAETKVTTKETLKTAIRKVHGMGVGKIVVTTFRDPETPETITIVGSEEGRMFEVVAQYWSRPYQGTGDLFAALLMGYSLAGLSLRDAVLKVLDSMKPVLDLTGHKFDDVVQGLDWRQEKAQGKGARITQACELRIVESAQAILHPTTFYTASELS